jgi:putative AbiEi antitoxin of type IV toxin-antitoxin system
MPNESRAYDEERSARVAAVASRQWGAVTHRQLLETGFSKDEVHRMVRKGFLIRMHRGVYVVGALSPAPEQRLAAALLAAGKGAALSHSGSASNFGWIQRRGDERLRIHARRSIEVTEHSGLPTTAPAQTLLDLAAQGWSIDCSPRKPPRRDSFPSRNSGRSRPVSAERGAPPNLQRRRGSR